MGFEFLERVREQVREITENNGRETNKSDFREMRSLRDAAESFASHLKPGFPKVHFTVKSRHVGARPAQKDRHGDKELLFWSVFAWIHLKEGGYGMDIVRVA